MVRFQKLWQRSVSRCSNGRVEVQQDKLPFEICGDRWAGRGGIIFWMFEFTLVFGNKNEEGQVCALLAQTCALHLANTRCFKGSHNGATLYL